MRVYFKKLRRQVETRIYSKQIQELKTGAVHLFGMAFSSRRIVILAEPERERQSTLTVQKLFIAASQL
jgi:hypothetical protein